MVLGLPFVNPQPEYPQCMPRRLRPVDIAREAGISVQQVRNYVDLGVLPPVARTETGYRVFTPDHGAAVVAVRRLAAGHGWARTRQIMRAVQAGDLDAALAAVDAGHAELDRERTDIARVLAAFDELAGSGTGAPVPRGTLRIGEVARLTGVRTSALRVWERYGLLNPARDRPTGYRVYDAAEVRNARVVALLRRGGYAISIVRAVLDELRATGSPQRVRTELAKREKELTERSRLRIAGTAALHTYLDERHASG